MARRTHIKRKHMGFKLMISRGEEKTGTWERVGFLFSTRFEAEAFHFRYYHSLPRRIVGVSLNIVPLEYREANNSRNDGRKPRGTAA